MRALLARIPRAAWLCALVAVLTGTAWAVLVPPFHVPDENAHVAYSQYLAETGNLPVRVPERAPLSEEINATLGALNFYNVIGKRGNKQPFAPADERYLREVEDDRFSRVGPDAGSATENGPLYYALTVVPYWLSPSRDLLDRMVLMRLISVLFLGLTAIAVFLFLREVLPNDPWLWTTGGLLAALEPMAGFMAGGVNPDTQLFFLSSLTLLAAARCLRRGLTVHNGMLLAGAVMAGLATKPLYQGMLPGVAVAVLACFVRGRRQIGLTLRGARAAAGLAAGAGLLYLALTNTLVERAGASAEYLGAAGGSHPTTERLSYIWQLFLPRLPFQEDLVEGFPLRDIWIPRLLGQFGWLEYSFPGWVDDVFFWLCMALVAGALAALVRFRHAVGPRVLELVTYLAFAGGVLVAIGWKDFTSQITDQPLFEQGRYLLPLIALMAGIACLALKGLGPRVGRPAGAALVMALLAATIYGQLLTIERFYA